MKKEAQRQVTFLFPLSLEKDLNLSSHPQLSRESSDLQLQRNKANNPNNNDNKMAGIQNCRQPQNTILTAIMHNRFGCNGEAMLPGMSKVPIKGSMLTHILKAVFHEGMELGNENGEKNHLKYF